MRDLHRVTCRVFWPKLNPNRSFASLLPSKATLPVRFPRFATFTSISSQATMLIKGKKGRKTQEVHRSSCVCQTKVHESRQIKTQAPGIQVHYERNEPHDYDMLLNDDTRGCSLIASCSPRQACLCGPDTSNELTETNIVCGGNKRQEKKAEESVRYPRTQTFQLFDSLVLNSGHEKRESRRKRNMMQVQRQSEGCSLRTLAHTVRSCRIYSP